MISNSEVVFDIYQKMMTQRIISAYHGEFTQQVVNMLLKQAKWDLESRNVDRITVKKSYSILVECLENILKHTKMMKEAAGTLRGQIDGIVILGYSDHYYYINVGNLVDVGAVDGLTKRLDKINNLDKDGLKDLHTEILTTGSISDKGGAGLGLIEIAMKSGNKIDYSFSNYNDEMSFFAMQVRLTNPLN